MPTNSIVSGWHTLDFISPLAQLAIILGINWVAIVLYVDAMISPSGTGIIYVGSSARMFTGMAEDKQMPSIFAKRTSYSRYFSIVNFVTLIFCMILVIFFLITGIRDHDCSLSIPINFMFSHCQLHSVNCVKLMLINRAHLECLVVLF